MFGVRRVRQCAAPFIILLLVASAACAQQHTWTGVERIVAVGDVHGDADRFVEVLKAAKVIDKDQNWIAGKTHLVQVGDVLDRWPDSRKAMDLLMKLEGQAVKAGGRVHALIGNHEVMVLDGNWHYLTPGEIKSHGGTKEFTKTMAADGKYGKWIRSHNAVIKINDSLFLHGGLDDRHGARSLDDLNKSVRKHLAGKGERANAATHPRGPLWYRGNALMTGEDIDADLAVITKTHKVKRVVIGHTISMGKIKLRAGGRVIMIDTAMSGYYKDYGGGAGCLIIDKGKLYEVYVGGKPQKLVIEKEEKEAAG
jgi:calcineurin-like phosphoesterase family protein